MNKINMEMSDKPIMETNIRKRNCNIELIRIVACIFVICLHTLSMSGGLSKTLIGEIKIIIIVAVPLFWLVTGYYIFNDKYTYIQKVKKTLVGILLPAIIVIFFMQFFSRWIYCENSFLFCIQNPEFDFKEVFDGLLIWDAKMKLSGHLWYVFAYLRLILFFPLLRYICCDKNPENKIRRGYIILFFTQLVISDVQYIVLPYIGLDKGINIPMPFDINIFYVLLGYEMYLFINKEKKSDSSMLKRRTICSMVLFILVVVIAMGVLNYCNYNNIGRNYFLSIKTCITVTLSMLLFYLLMHIPIKECFYKPIVFLSKKTFYVYIVHYMIAKKITKIYWLRDYLKNYNPILRLTIYITITIFVSFVLSTIILYLQNTVKRFCRHIRK